MPKTQVKKVSAFMDSSGRVHGTLRQAQKQQMRIDLSEWATQIGLCQGGEWSADMVIDAIADDFQTIKQICDVDPE